MTFIWLKATKHLGGTQGQGCGVWAETGVVVGQSRPFWLESELELESEKFGRLRLRPGVAD